MRRRHPEKTPNIGDIINYRINVEMVRAKVTAIQPNRAGAQIGQTLDIVQAEEI
jgi:ribosomal 50S subunit-recycling heat shock protein